MIDFYTVETPNGYRVELMLEEVDLSYNKYSLSFSNGEHRSAEFLKLNPSARIPVIIDHATTDNKDLLLTQSGAILLYLSEKTGRLLPENLPSRVSTYEWFCSDISDIATTGFDAFFLSKYDEVVTLLRQRIIEYYSIYDQYLGSSPYLGGDDYSFADVAAYPWARAMTHQNFGKLKNIKAWMQRVEQRPAVKKVFKM